MVQKLRLNPLSSVVILVVYQRGKEEVLYTPAETTTGVGPLKAPGENVAYVAEVEEEKRHPNNGVHYRRHFTPFGPRTGVPITLNTRESFLFIRRTEILKLTKPQR